MLPGEPLIPSVDEASPCDADSDVLRRTAGGDMSAFEILVDRHGATVARFLRGLTDNEAACEEALQETFISAWRGAASFRGAGSARAWLLSIARNAVNRQFRRRSGEPKVYESLADLGARAGWGTENADFLSLLEDREQLELGLRSLSPADRELLILRDLEGFTSPEVAELLELETEAVKSRLHRARLRFIANLTRGPNESS
jgi:RNA polymerase sigma-70 factor (ECF subfamily)